jgi:hypothetical protein
LSTPEPVPDATPAGSRALAESAVGLGLGAIRAVSAVTLRASASVVSPAGTFQPHLHGGASAALALGALLPLAGRVAPPGAVQVTRAL